MPASNTDLLELLPVIVLTTFYNLAGLTGCRTIFSGHISGININLFLSQFLSPLGQLYRPILAQLRDAQKVEMLGTNITHQIVMNNNVLNSAGHDADIFTHC